MRKILILILVIAILIIGGLFFVKNFKKAKEIKIPEN